MIISNCDVEMRDNRTVGGGVAERSCDPVEVFLKEACDVFLMQLSSIHQILQILILGATFSLKHNPHLSNYNNVYDF